LLWWTGHAPAPAPGTSWNGVGLSSYLSGNAELDQVVQETEMPNLFLVSSGHSPNPSELLARH
jgi:hypothetical protein